MGYEATREQVLNYLVDASIEEVETLLIAAGKWPRTSAPPPVPENIRWSVYVNDVPPHRRIPVIKTLRRITGRGLREVRSLVDNTPFVVVSDLLQDDALEVFLGLKRAGANVEIK